MPFALKSSSKSVVEQDAFTWKALDRFTVHGGLLAIQFFKCYVFPMYFPLQVSTCRYTNILFTFSFPFQSDV